MNPVQISDYQTTANGQMTHLYCITNSSGANVTLCDYGASVVSLSVYDKQHKLRDVVLGYSHIEGYETGGEYFGATVGRCCNRINKGQFTLNDQRFQLNSNDGVHHLHGGFKSFSRRIWDAHCKDNSVIFTTESPDGEENYPGNMKVTAVYTFDDNNTLTIVYNAVCDKDTICNMTNHSYFNLNGHKNGNIENHYLKINADKYIPMDSTSIPTGKIDPVADTPFDFMEYKLIKQALNSSCEQIKNASGLDHSFVIDKKASFQVAAYSSESGICLSCTTSQNAVHVYTANFVDVPKEMGKDGCAYGKRSGFCLETQNFPDAINHKNFPTSVLKANTPYRQVTQFHFSLKGEE